MAATVAEGLSLIELLFQKLDAFNEEKGVPKYNQSDIVDKNIIKSDATTFGARNRVSPILTSNEKRRTYNVGLELAQAFYDFNLKKQGDKSKPQTLIAEKKERFIDKASLKLQKAKKEAGFFTKLIAGIVLLSALVWKYFGGIGAFVEKMLLKLPQLLNLKIFTESKLLGPLLKRIGKRLGTKLLKFLRFVPLLGSLANFTFAYFRFKEGHWFKGILEIISGVANLIPGGQAISFMLDGALILSDLMESRGEGASASAGTKVAKYGLKAILKKIAVKYGMKLLKVLKWIPFVGGVAGIALAWIRFKEGDWLGGIFELISGIADFIPIYGNALSMFIDGGLLLYDILKTPKGEKKDVEGSQSSFSFKDLAIKIGKKVSELIWYVPGISGMMYLGQGIAKIFSGDFSGGLGDIGNSILGFIGGKNLVDAWGYVMGFFSDREKQTTGKIEAKKFSLGDLIGKLIGELATFIGDSIKKFASWAKEKLGNIIEEGRQAVTSGKEYIQATKDFVSDPFMTKRDAEAAKKTAELDAQMKKRVAERARREASAGYIEAPAREAARARREANGKKTVVAPASAETSTQLDNIRSNKVSVDLEEQNSLIIMQNKLLFELLNTAKQQLLATKKQTPVVINNGGESSSSSVNMDNAFQSNKQDGRSMFRTSPYTLSPA